MYDVITLNYVSQNDWIHPEYQQAHVASVSAVQMQIPTQHMVVSK